MYVTHTIHTRTLIQTHICDTFNTHTPTHPCTLVQKHIYVTHTIHTCPLIQTHIYVTHPIHTHPHTHTHWYRHIYTWHIQYAHAHTPTHMTRTCCVTCHTYYANIQLQHTATHCNCATTMLRTFNMCNCDAASVLHTKLCMCVLCVSYFNRCNTHDADTHMCDTHNTHMHTTARKKKYVCDTVQRNVCFVSNVWHYVSDTKNVWVVCDTICVSLTSLSSVTYDALFFFSHIWHKNTPFFFPHVVWVVSYVMHACFTTHVICYTYEIVLPHTLCVTHMK